MELKQLFKDMNPIVELMDSSIERLNRLKEPITICSDCREEVHERTGINGDGYCQCSGCGMIEGETETISF